MLLQTTTDFGGNPLVEIGGNFTYLNKEIPKNSEILTF